MSEPDLGGTHASEVLMAEKVHTYVLDTSVLLSDPGALLRFAEHHVVIPLIVVSELEGKRNHPELGFTARKALHILDDFRSDYDRLISPFRSVTRAERCGSSSTTSTPPRCRSASTGRRTTPASWPWPATSLPKAVTWSS